MDTLEHRQGAGNGPMSADDHSKPPKRTTETKHDLELEGLPAYQTLEPDPIRKTCNHCSATSYIQLQKPVGNPPSGEFQCGKFQGSGPTRNFRDREALSSDPDYENPSVWIRCHRWIRRERAERVDRGCGWEASLGGPRWMGMGGGLAHSLRGPVPLHRVGIGAPPSYNWPLGVGSSSSSSKTVSLPSTSVVAAVLVVMVVSMLGVPAATDARGLKIGGHSPSSSSEPQRQHCNIHQCWDLYLDTQDFFNIHIEYDPDRPHLDPSKHDSFCLAKRTFYTCLKELFRNKSLDCHSNIAFRGAFNGIERSMEGMNCSREGPTFDPSLLPSTGPERVCTYNGMPTMRFCALFGDPHLRTFADEFQTCQVQGAWPLLDNRYLTVQVTSKAVGAQSGPATAVTEVTVMIRAHEDCAAERFVTYQAQAGFLPSMFDDGSVHFGPDRSVVLKEVRANHHVEIYLRYIDTTVIVRHYPNLRSPFLTVALLMPEKILNQSSSHLPQDETIVRTLELCSRGCPSNQQIDYMSYLAKAQGITPSNVQSSGPVFTGEKNSVEGMSVMMSREEALHQCQRLRLVDMYLDSCVFDLMNTGTADFSVASADALTDLTRLHPKGWGAVENRTSLKPLPKHVETNAAQGIHNLVYIHRTMYVLMVAMATCAFTTGWWSGIVVALSSTFSCALGVSSMERQSGIS